MAVTDWSTTAASNNAAPPNGAPEGMSPGSVNDTIRQIMADVRTFYDSTALTSAANTFTLSQTLSSTAPALKFNETDGASNNKRWDIVASGEQLRFRVVNDADSSATDYLTIDRTATVVDTANIQATTVQFNGLNVTPKRPYKTADQTVSTTSLTNDTHLTIALDAAGYYAVDGFLYFNSVATSGTINLDLTTTSANQMERLSTLGGGSFGITGQDSYSSNEGVGDDLAGKYSSFADTFIHIKGVIQTHATVAPTVTLRWCPALAVSLVLRTGSWLEFRKLA
jgi:hypothetical protein